MDKDIDEIKQEIALINKKLEKNKRDNDSNILKLKKEIKSVRDKSEKRHNQIIDKLDEYSSKLSSLRTKLLDDQEKNFKDMIDIVRKANSRYIELRSTQEEAAKKSSDFMEESRALGASVMGKTIKYGRICVAVVAMAASVASVIIGVFMWHSIQTQNEMSKTLITNSANIKILLKKDGKIGTKKTTGSSTSNNNGKISLDWISNRPIRYSHSKYNWIQINSRE